MTRWFYERSRGPVRGCLREGADASQATGFKRIHPVNQKFTKTDLAKFENTGISCHGRCRGVQRRTSANSCSDSGSRALCAFAGILRDPDCQGHSLPLHRTHHCSIGPRRIPGPSSDLHARVDLYGTGQRIDLPSIWRAQAISEPVAEAIRQLGAAVRFLLVDSAGSRNVTEWAKKQECWDVVRAIPWQPADELGLVAVGRRTATKAETSVSKSSPNRSGKRWQR